MPIQPGNKATAAHFNGVASKVNKVFADNYPSATPSANILSTTVDGSTTVFPLGPSYSSDSFIVVILDGIATIYGWEINGSGELVFGTAPNNGVLLEVRDKTNQSHGWGNAAVGAVPSPEDIIEAVHVNQLVNRSNIVSDRTNTGVGFNTVNTDLVIEAEDLTTIRDYIDNVILTGNTRFHNELTETLAIETMTRTDPWSSQLTGIFDYRFTDYATARHFFNAGNEVKLDVDVTQPDATQFSWQNAADYMGSVLINYNFTRQTGYGGFSNCKGFYHLTTDWQTVFTSGVPLDYETENSVYFGEDEYCQTGYSGYSGYGGYSSYLTMTIVFDAKYQYNNDGTFSVLVRMTMDNSMFSTNVVTGTTQYIGGYLISEDLTENNISYSSPTPDVLVEDSLTGVNDS